MLRKKQRQMKHQGASQSSCPGEVGGEEEEKVAAGGGIQAGDVQLGRKTQTVRIGAPMALRGTRQPMQLLAMMRASSCQMALGGKCLRWRLRLSS